MKALAEIHITPRGSDLAARREAAFAHQLLRSSGLVARDNDLSTNVEGDLDSVLAAVKRLHEALQAHGGRRLSTLIKVGAGAERQLLRCNARLS